MGQGFQIPFPPKTTEKVWIGRIAMLKLDFSLDTIHNANFWEKCHWFLSSHEYSRSVLSPPKHGAGTNSSGGRFSLMSLMPFWLLVHGSERRVPRAELLTSLPPKSKGEKQSTLPFLCKSFLEHIEWNTSYPLQSSTSDTWKVFTWTWKIFTPKCQQTTATKSSQ